MPCTVEELLSERKAREEAQRQRNADLEVTTRFACEYCRMLEDEHSTIPEYAQEWWERHKVADEQRLVREAFNKLTPAEIKALKRSFASHS